MSVRRTKKGWMIDIDLQMPSGERRRIRKVAPVQAKHHALKYEHELRVAILAGSREEQKEVSFKNTAREFLEVYVAGQLKWATQITYRSTIETHLLPEFGGLVLQDITAQRIDQLRARLAASGLSPHTVRNTVGVLSRLLHVAQSWGYLGTVPRVSFPRVPTPGFHFLTEDECAAVLNDAGSYWYGPIYFGLMTGCRLGEIEALQREQLDILNRVVRIDRAVYRGKLGLPKHDKIRTIELSPELTAFLADHLKVVSLRSTLVFPQENGEMRQERTADKGLRRVAKRAGVAPFGWHVLRHTFASHLAMKGVAVQVIQQLLGHARIEETMRYAHLNPRLKRDAVGLLDNLGHARLRQPDGNRALRAS